MVAKRPLGLIPEYFLAPKGGKERIKPELPRKGDASGHEDD